MELDKTYTKDVVIESKIKVKREHKFLVCVCLAFLVFIGFVALLIPVIL